MRQPTTVYDNHPVGRRFIPNHHNHGRNTQSRNFGTRRKGDNRGAGESRVAQVQVHRRKGDSGNRSDKGNVGEEELSSASNHGNLN